MRRRHSAGRAKNFRLVHRAARLGVMPQTCLEALVTLADGARRSRHLLLDVGFLLLRLEEHPPDFPKFSLPHIDTLDATAVALLLPLNCLTPLSKGFSCFNNLMTYIVRLTGYHLTLSFSMITRHSLLLT